MSRNIAHISRLSHSEPQKSRRLAMVTGETSRPNPHTVQQKSNAQASSKVLPFSALATLLLSLLLPTWTSFYAGPLRLTLYRCILLVLAIPCFWKVYSRESSIKTQKSDWLVLAFTGWATCALLLNLGAEGAQTAGILAVETLGGYCVARCCVRTPADFIRLVKWLFWMVAFLLPFTLFECIRGTNLFDPRIPAIGARFGLNRAFGPFEHPILNGVFCGMTLGLVWFSYTGRSANRLARVGRAAIVAAAAMTSVSSGAMALLSTQTLLFLWNGITTWIPRRWVILAGLAGLAYAVVDMASNRTPMTVALYYLTFSPETAYGRIFIWDGGTAEIAKHPLFGNGTGNWDHPTWMSASMDNFWLYNGVCYGLPAAFAIMGAGAYVTWHLCRADWKRGSTIDRCRRAWLSTFAGLSVGASTVHLWNSSFVFFCILLGSGTWMLEWHSSQADCQITHAKI